MIKTQFSSIRSLALAGAMFLFPGIAAAQGQTTGQASSQPAMPASGGSMPAGGMMEKHDAMPGMAGMPMQDGMKKPATPPMAKDKPGCCGMKKMPMAKAKHAPHRRHAKPAAAKATPMPAADKPMPMKDDM